MTALRFLGAMAALGVPIWVALFVSGILTR